MTFPLEARCWPGIDTSPQRSPSCGTSPACWSAWTPSQDEKGWRGTHRGCHQNQHLRTFHTARQLLWCYSSNEWYPNHHDHLCPPQWVWMSQFSSLFLQFAGCPPPLSCGSWSVLSAQPHSLLPSQASALAIQLNLIIDLVKVTLPAIFFKNIFIYDKCRCLKGRNMFSNKAHFDFVDTEYQMNAWKMSIEANNLLKSSFMYLPSNNIQRFTI